MQGEKLKDKVPPHSIEAEKATLGAILLDSEAIPVVSGFLKPSDFYLPQHEKLYAGIMAMNLQGLVVDLLTLSDYLRQKGELEAVGGAAYLASLTDAVPSSANVEYYGRIVRENSLRRSLIKVSSETRTEAYDEKREARGILEEAQKKLFELSGNEAQLSYKSVKDIIPLALKEIEILCQTKEPFTGVPSGFEKLDEMTTGFQKSEMIVIGARPSVGKTALALSMAANVTIRYGKPAGFFTLEMPDKAILQRLIASEGMISSQKLRTGLLKTSDFHNLTMAAGKIYEAPLYISDLPNIRLLDLRTIARRMRQDKKIEILFIDYLTLIGSENPDIPRHEQIAEISRSLKALARELEIPVIVLSQVKRESEGKRPSLADLRESGSIEQDADVVMFLHRERESDKPADERDKRIKTELILAKQRNGPVGTIEIGFLPEFAKFVELADERR
jgi:replicative DNA helicase